jgi:hypothetical protein
VALVAAALVPLLLVIFVPRNGRRDMVAAAAQQEHIQLTFQRLYLPRAFGAIDVRDIPATSDVRCGPDSTRLTLTLTARCADRDHRCSS